MQLDFLVKTKQKFQWCNLQNFLGSKTEKHQDFVQMTTDLESKKVIQHSFENFLLERNKQIFDQTLAGLTNFQQSELVE